MRRPVDVRAPIGWKLRELLDEVAVRDPTGSYEVAGRIVRVLRATDVPHVDGEVHEAAREDHRILSIARLGQSPNRVERLKGFPVAPDEDPLRRAGYSETSCIRLVEA